MAVSAYHVHQFDWNPRFLDTAFAQMRLLAMPGKDACALPLVPAQPFSSPRFSLAIWIVDDGLSGPQLPPMNGPLALAWTDWRWRGFTVIGSFIAVNFFCLLALFHTPSVGYRNQSVSGPLNWPRRLRSKWLGLWAGPTLSLEL